MKQSRRKKKKTAGPDGMTIEDHNNVFDAWKNTLERNECVV